MTPFRVNDRVWYWSAASQTVFGTVVAIERLADVVSRSGDHLLVLPAPERETGTQLLVIERDTGGRVSFPLRTSWVDEAGSTKMKPPVLASPGLPRRHSHLMDLNTTLSTS
ncbi:hypothetical protein FB107DRAFT_251746 [Schizophyllum commune]